MTTEASAAAPPTLYDTPTAAELVEAVREFIETQVVPATEGSVQFHARVAANVLGIVERELVHGPAADAAHHERLAELGYADDAALAAALRTGSADDTDPRIRAAVELSIRAKLVVANPRHLQETT